MSFAVGILLSNSISTPELVVCEFVSIWVEYDVALVLESLTKLLCIFSAVPLHKHTLKSLYFRRAIKYAKGTNL